MNKVAVKIFSLPVRKAVYSGAAVLLLFICAALSAEVLYLKSGELFQGKITAQTMTHITIQTRTAQRYIAKSTIRKIMYDEDPEAKARQEAERQRLIRLAAERKAREKEEAALRLQNEVRMARHTFDYQQAQIRAARARYYRELVAAKKIEKPAGVPLSFVDFAWRSALVPGWGHFYLGKPIIGGAYMGLSALSLYAVATLRGPAVAMKKENEDQVNLNLATMLYFQPGQGNDLKMLLLFNSNHQLATQQQGRVDNYNRAVMFLGAVYGLQILHILFNGIAWQSGWLVQNDIQAESFTMTVFAAPAAAPARGDLAAGSRKSVDTFFSVNYFF